MERVESMMINKIVQLRNIGRFGSVSLSNLPPLGRFSVIFAENGQGKTTLSEIFRSLSTGESDHILNRKRLQSSDVDAPHVTLDASGTLVIFDGENWSETIPNISIFDDIFVDENVCSGIEIDSAHRKNMHEIIVGKQGKDLFIDSENKKDNVKKQKEIANKKESAISETIRGPFKVTEFCNLEESEDIEKDIKAAEQKLAATKSSDEIKKHKKFESIKLPDFDMIEIEKILKESIDDIESNALENIKKHVKILGTDGEKWLSDGMPLIDKASTDTEYEVCPFCEQKIDGLKIIGHYRIYFGDAYKNLKNRINEFGINTKDSHSDIVIEEFDKRIREINNIYAFWKRYAEIESVEINVNELKTAWRSARESVLCVLRQKAASPLDPRELSQEIQDHVEKFKSYRDNVSNLSNILSSNNLTIDEVKKSVSSSSVEDLERKLIELKARKSRFDPEVIRKCNEYKKSLVDLGDARTARKTALKLLDKYRDEIFPSYKDTINEYLSRFATGYKIGSIDPINVSSGPSVNYAVLIDDKSVPVTNATGPSFKTLLSAGDRSTLAFAFFLASLDNGDGIEDKIVILDDPITSLDEHRLNRTIEMIRSLVKRAGQVIVLSHSRSFLYSLWEDVHRDDEVRSENLGRASARIVGSVQGSQIEVWNITDEKMTSYSRNHKLVRDYVSGCSYTQNGLNDVNVALRIVIEGYLSIVFAEDFSAVGSLGNFVSLCVERDKEGEPIVSKRDLDELKVLKNYANKFHHNSDALKTISYNEQEFLNFAKYTLDFCKRTSISLDPADIDAA